MFSFRGVRVLSHLNRIINNKKREPHNSPYDKLKFTAK